MFQGFTSFCWLTAFTARILQVRQLQCTHKTVFGATHRSCRFTLQYASWWFLRQKIYDGCSALGLTQSLTNLSCGFVCRYCQDSWFILNLNHLLPLRNAPESLLSGAVPSRVWFLPLRSVTHCSIAPLIWCFHVPLPVSINERPHHSVGHDAVFQTMKIRISRRVFVHFNRWQHHWLSHSRQSNHIPRNTIKTILMEHPEKQWCHEWSFHYLILLWAQRSESSFAGAFTLGPVPAVCSSSLPQSPCTIFTNSFLEPKRNQFKRSTWRANFWSNLQQVEDLAPCTSDFRPRLRSSSLHLE